MTENQKPVNQVTGSTSSTVFGEYAATREKLADAENTPGHVAEFDPAEAEDAGAFEEDALSEEDAADASPDLLQIDAGKE